MNLTEEDISPEFVGCVLTCLSGGGIDNSRVVFMCLAGCYASTYLRDDQTNQDQDPGQSDDEDDDQFTQLQEALENAGQQGEQTGTDELQLEKIEGLNSTYADRLRVEDIETLTALAQADPRTVAEAAEISESRAAEWIQKAQKHQ